MEENQKNKNEDQQTSSFSTENLSQSAGTSEDPKAGASATMGGARNPMDRGGSGLSTKTGVTGSDEDGQTTTE